MIGAMKLCDEDRMQALIAALELGAGDEIQRADALLLEFPDDPRLHFLRGSLLAGIGRSIEALPALRKAVELAPDMAIARFQLGFFLLTSGEPGEALSVWGPLALLPEDHYLRLFVGGLTHLIRDEFADAIRLLEIGIAANQENPPLNRDMQLIITQTRMLLDDGPVSDDDDSISATSLLLGQYGPRRTH